MKSTLVTVWTLAIMVLSLANVSHAVIMNGDFSDGLNAWTIDGDVGDADQVARLGDADPHFYGGLYQIAPFKGGTYFLEFDFKNMLSDDLISDPNDPNYSFSFYDTFLASIYYIDDIAQFDLTSLVYDDADALFDMDAFGVLNNNGVIGPSAKGQDWLHFSTTFNNTYAYVIPTFELLDFNFIDADSQVLIDNVSVNPVPEPATLLLLGSGLFALAGMARRRRKSS